MGYRLPGLCSVKEMATNSLIAEVLRRNVDELLGHGEELNLEAMNRTDIPFDGWIEVGFRLPGENIIAHELTVPVLVRATGARVLDRWIQSYGTQ